MVGTETDGSGKHTIPREGSAEDSGAVPPPVLGSMSDAELEAAVSVLRTDKNQIVAPAQASSPRWGAATERLLHSGSRPFQPVQAAAAREEAARHAWFIALGERVVGPLELEALQTYWNRGELGPDSLCWREGFEFWQRVCRVRTLSEALAPSPEQPVSARHLVPVDPSEGPGFQLKGTEALSALVRSTPPPLPPQVAAQLAPMLDPEPVTAPAAPALLDPVPVAAPMGEVAGTHPVVHPTQVEVRIRGGMWLALGGGLVGGVLVALVLWGLGLRGGMGPGLHTGAPSAGVSPSAPVTAAPSTEAPKPAMPGAPMAGPGLAQSAAFQGTSGFLPPLGVPDLSTVASGVTDPGPAQSTALPLTRSAPTSSAVKTEPMPQRVAVAPRPMVTAPPLRKVEKVEVAFEQEAPVKEAREAPPAAEDDLDEALGPDEAFERELSGPPGGAKKAVAQRTVWIPPEPARPEAPASLSQSDIFTVVLANKGDIAACVGAGKPQGTEEGKRVVVRWSIAPSGKVSDVVTETAAFQGTALASCLEAKIRTWTFPKHREQGGAVRFPFVF
ncbi:MAG TPA: AgmX/PglI C-terminal domain-containing protein [Myxococcaceae bacterium]